MEPLISAPDTRTLARAAPRQAQRTNHGILTSPDRTDQIRSIGCRPISPAADQRSRTGYRWDVRWYDSRCDWIARVARLSCRPFPMATPAAKHWRVSDGLRRGHPHTAAFFAAASLLRIAYDTALAAPRSTLAKSRTVHDGL